MAETETPTKSAAAKPAGMAALVKNAQFPWFVGHIFVLLGGFFYMLGVVRIFKSPGFPLFWYRLAYVAAMATFAITLKESYLKKPPSAAQLTQDDNVHYLLVALLWLVSKPSMLTLIPFMIFSLFHVVTFTRSSVLPAVGKSSDTGLGGQLKQFATTYNEQLLAVASQVELLLLFFMIPSALTFKKVSLIPFLFYLVFIKVRFDQSFHMRQAVKTWEVRADNLMSNPNVPPAVKQGWISFKQALAKGLSTVSFKKPAPAKAT